jgi:hypothetical protein
VALALALSYLIILIIMEKKEIIVPKGIRYVGEIDENTKRRKWSEFNIRDFNEQCIINKVLTGCGFTEYCIKCETPIILMSPRRFLLDNKWEQHLGEVYYFRNNDEVSIDFELDLGDDKKAIEKRAKTKEEGKHITIDNLDKIKNNLRTAYESRNPLKPFKILVTYDSFRHVKDVLTHIVYSDGSNAFDKFYIVVDEFQSIFIDARFKSTTEIELLNQLKDVQKVCYVSATPMLDTYLEMLDEFKDLPYYQLNWEKEEPGRVIKPWLDVKFTVGSLNSEAKKIIQRYKDGKFDSVLNEETEEFVESKEAVLFFNSVYGLCQVIKTNMLHLDQVNVLCSDSTDNDKKVRAAFNEVLRKETEELSKHPKIPKETPVIGRIPTKGEPHKMFTLCTRTVYLGADFYSTNAQTFIFSDSNIACLSVDISMDLEQILGRQRLKENPWKNCATMFVRTTDKKHKMGKLDYDKYLDDKIHTTELLLENYRDINKTDNKYACAKAYQTIAEMCHYKDNYIAVSVVKKDWKSGEVSWLEPVFNNLMLVSEKRAFDVQQVDYRDRFSVFNAIGKENLEGVTIKACEMAIEFNELGDSNKKLKLLVGLKDAKDITDKDINSFLELIPPKYKRYYTVMGPEFIKTHSCLEAEINREWKKKLSNDEKSVDITSEILKIFKVGDRYSKSDIKSILTDLYKKLGYQKTAKATDLDSLFTMKLVKVVDKSGKKSNGFELLKKK